MDDIERLPAAVGHVDLVRRLEDHSQGLCRSLLVVD
jgi:hypothetical protein